MAPATSQFAGLPPLWVMDVVQGGVARDTTTDDGEGRVVSASGFSLLSLVVPACVAASPERFEEIVCRCYRWLGAALAEERRFPVRLWNFVPGINDAAGPGVDRYMVFNAGRFAGYSQWEDADLSRWVPAASAVGSRDGAFAVHCLAADAPGVPLENPRQIPAYRYSRRYGPRPPCFARATIVGRRGSALLLVSGTASIRGEDSMHVGSLDGQLQVTIDNLRHVQSAALEREPDLGGLTDARVYVPFAPTDDLIVDQLRMAFPSLARVETQTSALCRRELLVEIEAASLPLAPARDVAG